MMSIELRRGTRLEDPPVDVQGSLNTVSNLSRGGMCIVCDDCPEVGQKRRYDLVDRRTGKSCTLWGEVRWVEPLGKGRCRVGVQWFDIDLRASDWLAVQMEAAEGAEGRSQPAHRGLSGPITWL